MEKEYSKKVSKIKKLEVKTVFQEKEVLRIGFDRVVFKIRIEESFNSESPVFQILCVNNSKKEGNLTFNPNRILRGHNVSNATNEEINICLDMIKDNIPNDIIFEIIGGKEIEINFNWLTKSDLKYFKFFYIQLVDVLFKEFNFNLVDHRINKNNWDIDKNFSSDTESIKVFKMKGKNKLLSLKIYPKSIREEIENLPKDMILMRMEMTIHSTGIKSYFKANNSIELNKAILNFFEKLGERLFLRLVDESTGRVKKSNKYNFPLKEFLEPFEKNVQDLININKTNS